MNDLLNFYPFVIVQREYLGSKLAEEELANRILGEFYRVMDQHKEITKLRRMPNAVVFQSQLFYNLTSAPARLFAPIDEGSITLIKRENDWLIEYRYSLRHSLFIALLLSIFVALGLGNILLIQFVSPVFLALAFVPALLRQQKWFQKTLRSLIKTE